jgi:hypothetical protein
MIRLPLLSATALKSYPMGPILGCPYGSKLLRLPSGRRFFLSGQRIRLFRNHDLPRGIRQTHIFWGDEQASQEAAERGSVAAIASVISRPRLMSAATQLARDRAGRSDLLC